MKTMSSVLTRRDRCYLYGRRGQKLTDAQAVIAWRALSEKLEAFGEKDVPKFNDLLIAFYVALRRGRRLAPKAEFIPAPTICDCCRASIATVTIPAIGMAFCKSCQEGIDERIRTLNPTCST